MADRLTQSSSTASEENLDKETAGESHAHTPGLDCAETDGHDLVSSPTTEAGDGPKGVESEFPDEEKQAAQSAGPVAAPSPSARVDGGLKAWLCVLGGFCAMFTTFGWITAMGVFQTTYQTTILSSYSPSTVSWIVSLEAFMMYFNGFWIGLLCDNYGPRPVVALGTVMHVSGILGASFGTRYWHFILSQGIISPIGAACIFYPAMNMVVAWFDKRRGLALGLNAAGGSAGGVIFPIMVQNLIPRVGFGWAMRAVDLVIIVLLIISNLTLRPRLTPSPRRFSPKQFVAPLGERHFALLTLGSFFVYLGFFIPYTFLPVQALQAGVAPTLAFYIVPILNAASIFGRITPAWLSDSLGHFNVNLVMTVFCAVVTLAMWLPGQEQTAVLIVYAVCYGFGTGAFVAILVALVAQVSSDLRSIGTRTGALFSCTSIATLIGNPIAGALLGPTRDQYTHLIIFAGVFLAAGTVVLAILRMQLSGGKLWAKV